jgi:hypothetical protein
MNKSDYTLATTVSESMYRLDPSTRASFADPPPSRRARSHFCVSPPTTLDPLWRSSRPTSSTSESGRKRNSSLNKPAIEAQVVATELLFTKEKVRILANGESMDKDYIHPDLLRRFARPVLCSTWDQISSRLVIGVERIGEGEDEDGGGDEKGFEAMGWSGDGSDSAEEGVFWALHNPSPPAFPIISFHASITSKAESLAVPPSKMNSGMKGRRERECTSHS